MRLSASINQIFPSGGSCFQKVAHAYEPFELIACFRRRKDKNIVQIIQAVAGVTSTTFANKIYQKTHKQSVCLRENFC